MPLSRDSICLNDNDIVSPYELGEIGAPECVPILIKYLNSRSHQDSKLAASAIGKIAVKHKHVCNTAIPALINALNSDGPQVRQYALKTLLLLDITSEYIDKFVSISTNDEKEYNREGAKNILKKLKVNANTSIATTGISNSHVPHDQELPTDNAIPKSKTVSGSEASCKFDLLLFDLDDTLVKSSHLVKFRGRENIGNSKPSYLSELKEEATTLSKAFSMELLNEIREDNPTIKFGIFTRSPKIYCETLLATCYPNFKWDCIITFEDVSKTKPHPEGIIKAARLMGVSNLSRVIYVGDEKSDIVAAYQAGTFAILSRLCWGGNWQNENPGKIKGDHYEALYLCPDAVIDTPAQLIRLINKPSEALIALESWCDSHDCKDATPKLRTESINHFNNLEKPAPFVKINILGRYFASHHSSDQYNYSPKCLSHHLTRVVLDAKDRNKYPKFVVDCCVEYIKRIYRTVKFKNKKMLVCTIPARPGRPNRLEVLLEAISQALMVDKTDIIFNSNLLKYKDGVVANKDLTNKKRYENVRDHLSVTDGSISGGEYIMVFDDVTTTGATFFYADKYLRASGAERIYCVALTQTISS